MKYGAAVWGNVFNTQLHKLQVVQNKFLRAAFDAPWFVRNAQLHREANLPTIREYRQDVAGKLYENAANHPNPLVRESVNYDVNVAYHHPRPKYLLLRQNRSDITTSCQSRSFPVFLLQISADKRSFVTNNNLIGVHFTKYDIQGCILKMCRNFTYEVVVQRRRLKATIKKFPQKLNANLVFDIEFFKYFFRVLHEACSPWLKLFRVFPLHPVPFKLIGYLLGFLISFLNTKTQ
jgi:hypothetical protein